MINTIYFMFADIEPSPVFCDIDDYFGLETLKLIVRQPLALTETDEKFDVVCRVSKRQGTVLCLDGD